VYSFNWTPLNSAIVGAAVTAFLAFIREMLKSPIFRYKKITGPWSINNVPLSKLPERLYDANAYRLRVENEKKLIPLNAAAENCVCWLNVDGEEETFQLPWIGRGESVDINVDDYRELDFCARSMKTSQILIPSIHGYSLPITIGDGTQPITGSFRVTSKNGKKEERKFTIIPIENNQLKFKIDNPPIPPRAQEILIGTLFGLILGIVSNLWVSVFDKLFLKNMSSNMLSGLFILYSIGTIGIGALLWYYINK